MRKLSVLVALLLCAALMPTAAFAQQPPMRVWGLIGPTGMSLAPIISEASPAYDIRLAAAPEELVGTIVSGNYDIAAIPTNLAAVLYQKTQGAVQLLAINTLGVLSILEKGDTVSSVKNLKGRTVMLSGQGAVPEYALSFILTQHGIDAQLDYKSEHNEVSALAAAGKADLVMLPQPMATALLVKDPAFRVALDITDAFSDAAALAGQPDAVLSMGCLVVRRAFAEESPERVAAFLQRYEGAVAFVNDSPADAAKDIVAAGIIPVASIAEQAIPLSHIVCVTGDAMRRQLSPLFDILFNANPASVGGQVPDDGIYYMPQP